MEVLNEITEQVETKIPTENVETKQSNNTIETLKKLLETNDDPKIKSILEKEQKKLDRELKKKQVQVQVKNSLSIDEKNILMGKALENDNTITSYTKLYNKLKQNGTKIMISRSEAKSYYIDYKKRMIYDAPIIKDNLNENIKKNISQSIKENLNDNINETINNSIQEHFKSFEDKMLEHFSKQYPKKIEKEIIEKPIEKEIKENVRTEPLRMKQNIRPTFQLGRLPRN